MGEFIIEPIIEEPPQQIVEPIVEEPPQPIGVYVKVNTNNEIVGVGSDIFIKDLTGWTQIDEGFGDKYAHAQSQYFAKPLVDEAGRYTHKFVNGEVVEVEQ